MNKRIDEIFDQVMDEDCANPLYRFAELVRADERELCAKACDPYTHGQWFAKAIRGRTE
jgi:hypothetical protein